jgi:hypothetical protein
MNKKIKLTMNNKAAIDNITRVDRHDYFRSQGYFRSKARNTEHSAVVSQPKSTSFDDLLRH